MAANDIIDLADARRTLGIGSTDTSTDADLTALITESSMFLDDLCAPIVSRSVTETVLEPTGAVFLKVPPGSPTFTVTFTSVTEYNAGVATVLSAEDFDTAGTYRWEPLTGRLLRRSSWSTSTWGLQEVVVIYTAGRFANTAAVSEKFKGACRQVLAHKWQARGRTIAIGAPVGGEGPPGFAGIPYSPTTLLKNLQVILRDELLMDAMGLAIA